MYVFIINNIIINIGDTGTHLTGNVGSYSNCNIWVGYPSDTSLSTAKANPSLSYAGDLYSAEKTTINIAIVNSSYCVVKIVVLIDYSDIF